MHGLGQLFKPIPASLHFLGLVGHLAVASLNAFLFHCQGPVHLYSGHKQRLDVSADTPATSSAYTVFCGTIKAFL